MEIYETIAWVALGFFPALLAMEIAYKLSGKLRTIGKKENALVGKMTGGYVE